MVNKKCNIQKHRTLCTYLKILVTILMAHNYFSIDVNITLDNIINKANKYVNKTLDLFYELIETTEFECSNNGCNECFDCGHSIGGCQTYCLSECKEGYFKMKVNNKNQCIKCLDHCLECTQYRKCTKCEEGFINNFGTCISSNYFVKDYNDETANFSSLNITGIASCEPNLCTNCDKDQNKCLDCTYLFENLNGTCYPCSLIDSNCVTCHKSKCYVCNKFHTLDKLTNKCILNSSANKEIIDNLCLLDFDCNRAIEKTCKYPYTFNKWGDCQCSRYKTMFLFCHDSIIVSFIFTVIVITLALNMLTIPVCTLLTYLLAYIYWGIEAGVMITLSVIETIRKRKAKDYKKLNNNYYESNELQVKGEANNDASIAIEYTDENKANEI